MTPSLKELALAAVEADAAMKNENHLTTKYALVKESQAALGASHAAATPERILQYRDEVLEEAAQWHDERRMATPDAFEMEFHEKSASAIRSLKSKEPTSSGMENEQ